MEWFALLIPIFCALVLFVGFRKHTTWWELIIPAAVSAIFILCFKGCVKTTMITDTEYHGNLIVEARYYEYWETWVVETCSRQVPDGEDCSTDANGTRHCTTRYRTEYYDCSHNDPHEPYWVAVDDKGNETSISREYYERLVKKWSATPQFVDMDRDINYSHGYGKDGDMYKIRWNGAPETSETRVTEHSYTNKIQASHSSFKLPTIEPEEAQKLGLYEYPKYYDYYKQRAVLGLEALYAGDSLERIETLFQYLNGYYGPKNKVKFFVNLFYDKPLQIAFKQEAFWDGGNQNEVVINIGIKKATREIMWVKSFSWTNDKRFLIDLRRKILETQTFQPVLVYNIIQSNIKGDLHRSFRNDFDYLQVDLPDWADWTIWIVTFVLSIGISIWCLANEFENEHYEEEPEKPNQRWMDSYGSRKPYSYSAYESVGERLKKRFAHAWEQLKKK